MSRTLPPTLFVICLAGMVMLHLVLPVARVVDVPLDLLGLLPLVLGVVLSVSADRTSKRVGTNVKTFDEPDKLVTGGPFRYSRNPMYLGFVLMLGGVWILLGTASPALGVVTFFLVSERHYIPFEEGMLSTKFGQQFEAYAAKTGRWI